MPIVRTRVMSASGVKLIKVETMAGDRVTDLQYRVTTLRQAQPRMIADRELAEAAFLQEVTASKADPVAVRLAMSGF
ncbi:hypothetical protein [Brevundimonas sp.]|uniref:hypothetical protein n=1 Tax=Brevundimonas sp. TaxID=1871086 RepID=UPI003BA91335